MNEINVFGLRLLPTDYYRGRSRILAHFDCDTRGLRLLGCALLIKGRSLLVAGPRMNADRSVRFLDNDIAEEIKKQALALFHQFGGTLPEEQVAHLPDGVRAMLSSSATGAMQ